MYLKAEYPKKKTIRCLWQLLFKLFSPLT